MIDASTTPAEPENVISVESRDEVQCDGCPRMVSRVWARGKQKLCYNCKEKYDRVTTANLKDIKIDVSELPTGLLGDSTERKNTPMFSGVLAYFPDALAEVSRLSKVGNDKHNPGQPLHWAKEKSTDHKDCIVRHLADHSKGERFVPDYPGKNIRALAAVAWRALAALQIEIESEQGK